MGFPQSRLYHFRGRDIVVNEDEILTSIAKPGFVSEADIMFQLHAHFANLGSNEEYAGSFASIVDWRSLSHRSTVLDRQSV